MVSGMEGTEFPLPKRAYSRSGKSTLTFACVKTPTEVASNGASSARMKLDEL